MKKLKSISLSMATALIFTTAFSTSAEAQPAGFGPDSPSAIPAVSNAANISPKGIEGEQCKKVDDSGEAGKTTSATGTAELQNVQQAVTYNQIRLQVGDDQARWEASELIEFEGEDESIVAVPLNSSEKEQATLVTTLNPEGNIISYSETHVQSISDEEAHVSKWANGNLETDQTYNANAPQVQRGLGEIYQRLNDCLGAHGVSTVLAGVIAGACSLAGGIAGVTACIVGYGILGGTGGFCAGYAIRGTGNQYA